MSVRVGEILMDIKTKIPSIFQAVIDNCKVVVEDFETHLRTIQNDAQQRLDRMTDDSLMPEETLKRFREDHTKALIKFRDETERKLRRVSEKALSKIRDLNKKSQDVVNEVVDFQRDVQERIARVVEDNKTTPEYLANCIKDEVDPLHKKFGRMQKEVDKITKTLPKRMEVIYKDLFAEVKKLEEQTNKHLESLVEKYQRLTGD